MGLSGLSQPLKPRILHFFECRLAKGLLSAFSLGLIQRCGTRNRISIAIRILPQAFVFGCSRI
jgi:hypothetical protein